MHPSRSDEDIAHENEKSSEEFYKNNLIKSMRGKSMSNKVDLGDILDVKGLIPEHHLLHE